MCTKQQQSAGREIKGEPNIYRIVQRLWVRAEAGLSDQELEWFADGDGQVEAFMGYIADAAERIGSALFEDAGIGKSGEKQDVSGLLFLLAESVRCARALAIVKSNASELIRDRRSMS
jgi:hypothetical protein